MCKMNSIKIISQFLVKSPPVLGLNIGCRYLSNNANIYTFNQINEMKNEVQQKGAYSACKTSSRNFSKKKYSVSTITDAITDDLHDFEALYPDIIQELMERLNQFGSKETTGWFKRALEYNVAKGKRYRALLTTSTYKCLAEEITPANVRLAHVLGWCLELQQSFFIVCDDIMDDSITRRKQLCWHKVDDVGIIALNDAIMFEQSLYYLLRNNFRHLKCYLDLVNTFHESTLITSFGQSLDLLSAKQNILTFTQEQYRNIAVNKTAHYTCYTPVALGMHLAGCKDSKAFEVAKRILLELGVMFQIQDDFLDCFGTEEITGKIGTDIKDNKCSWLAVECMLRANEQQKALMLECYGSSDLQKIACVKQLYMDLKLPKVYADYEGNVLNKIKQSLEQIPKHVPREVILKMVNTLSQRSA